MEKYKCRRLVVKALAFMFTRVLTSILAVAVCPVVLQACTAPEPDSSVVKIVRDSVQVGAISGSKGAVSGREGAVLREEVDSIHVVKHQRKMWVYAGGRLLKEYHISLGLSPVGAKRFQGDMRTPEGLYYINGKNPKSMAHKNLGISYPNDRDRSLARRYGKPPGGDIKIHGMVNGWEAKENEYLNTDWTWGCIAISNKDIDELYEHVQTGIPICIVP